VADDLFLTITCLHFGGRLRASGH